MFFLGVPSGSPLFFDFLVESMHSFHQFFDLLGEFCGQIFGFREIIGEIEEQGFFFLPWRREKFPVALSNARKLSSGGVVDEFIARGRFVSGDGRGQVEAVYGVSIFRQGFCYHGGEGRQ